MIPKQKLIMHFYHFVHFAANIPQLPYLASVIEEVLRFACPAPRATHRITHLFIISADEGRSVEIPADTVVIANFWAVSRDPNYWTEPSNFNPDAHFPLELAKEKSAASGVNTVNAICTIKTKSPTLF